MVGSLLAGLSGALFAACTPPFDAFLGIPLGLSGLAWSLHDVETSAPRTTRTSIRGGARRGFLFGLVTNLLALRFVPEVVVRFTNLPHVVAWLALVFLAVAQALPWAIGGAVTKLLHARAHTFFPLAFAIGVFVATGVPSIFPWTPAGGLSPWPALVQSAELVGERGASFLVALACGLVVHGIAHARHSCNLHSFFGRHGARSLGAGTVLVLGMVGGGALRMRAIERTREQAPSVHVALVQPGFEAGDRWDPQRAQMMLDRLTHLTELGEAHGATLTIWPESAYPYTLAHAARSAPRGDHAIVRPSVHGPVVTGIYMVDDDGTSFNAAALATDDGALSEPYDKRHLLWFGETIPLSDTFPWLRNLLGRGPGLSPGHDSTLLRTGPVRAAVLNCYEDTLGGAGREAMEHGPNLLVNVTNDAWFVGSIEGELHLRLSVLRAIEARRDFVRAVNRGPTSFVDATGRVRSRYEDALPSTLLVSPALLETPPTFFTRYGDAPLTLLLISAVAASFVHATKSSRRRLERSDA